jgi:hypothetical protein
MKGSILFLMALSVLFINTNCSKEAETDLPEKNAPKADAGPDINLEIPRDWTPLTGKASDTDGSIESFKWTRISGPQAYLLEEESTASARVVWMEEGEYQFELTVTDNGGLVDKDTVKVRVTSNLQKMVIKGDDLELQSNGLPGKSVPTEVYDNLKWVFCNYGSSYQQADDGPQPGIDYWLGGGNYFERVDGNIITYFGYDELKDLILYY